MVTTTQLLAGNFNRVGTILESFLREWWVPLLGALSAAAGILAFSAGIKYIIASKSGDENKLKQAKDYVKGILIGILIVFLLAGLLPIIVACFQSWVETVEG